MTGDELTTYERATVRSAMLNAFSAWLEEAALERGRGSITGGTIATVIADAFRVEADKYKTPRTKETDDDGSAEGFLQRHVDAEPTVVLPAESGGGAAEGV